MSNQYQPGEGHIPSYQMSATPFVTSSQISLGNIHEYQFKNVTRFFTIQNKSATVSNKISIGFTLNGLKSLTGNFFTLNGGESYSGDIRMTNIFVSGSSGNNVAYQIIAGLTPIPYKNMVVITGSNGFEGVG